MALLTHEPVHVTGALTKQVRNSQYFPSGEMAYMSVIPSPRPAMTGVTLNAAKCADIQRLWDLLDRDSPQQFKAFSLALRRLGYALQRNRPEDRMLDVAIAAEAFYLTENGKPSDRGEMRYRLSLRAAVWGEATMSDWTRLEIFQQMRAGYDVRSALAHGGSPDPKILKIKGESIPETELLKFVQCIEDVVRAGLYKYFQNLDKSTPGVIEWDSIVLGEVGAKP